MMKLMVSVSNVGRRPVVACPAPADHVRSLQQSLDRSTARAAICRHRLPSALPVLSNRHVACVQALWGSLTAVSPISLLSFIFFCLTIPVLV